MIRGWLNIARHLSLLLVTSSSVHLLRGEGRDLHSGHTLYLRRVEDTIRIVRNRHWWWWSIIDDGREDCDDCDNRTIIAMSQMILWWKRWSWKLWLQVITMNTIDYNDSIQPTKVWKHIKWLIFSPNTTHGSIFQLSPKSNTPSWFGLSVDGNQ